MIAFTSYPTQANHAGQGSTRHHPGVEDALMIDNDEDFGTGGTKLTVPGESLTSSQAYMRSVTYPGSSIG
jgi:exosome complex component RRP4